MYHPLDTDLCASVRILTDSGTAIPCYDDGTGPLWVLWEGLEIIGVIRASTREDAYEIAEDEFFSEADQTWEEIAKECDCSNPDDLMDNGIFQENYGVRPNGANDRDKRRHGIYQRDLNGGGLERLTVSMMELLKLTVGLADGC